MFGLSLCCPGAGRDTVLGISCPRRDRDAWRMRGDVLPAALWGSTAGVHACGARREYDKNNARILLANLLQSSRRTFSCESFLSFCAFQEGMLGTPISVCGGWPTVSARYFDRVRGPQYCQRNAYGNSVQQSTFRLGMGQEVFGRHAAENEVNRLCRMQASAHQNAMRNL